MNHDAPACPHCRDTGLVSSRRWWDDEAELELCERPGCWAAAERAQEESDRTGSLAQQRCDLAGVTPSPGGASDDAGVQFATRRAS